MDRFGPELTAPGKCLTGEQATEWRNYGRTSRPSAHPNPRGLPTSQLADARDRYVTWASLPLVRLRFPPEPDIVKPAYHRMGDETSDRVARSVAGATGPPLAMGDRCSPVALGSVIAMAETSVSRMTRVQALTRRDAGRRNAEILDREP
jgi:hypothetical protein